MTARESSGVVVPAVGDIRVFVGELAMPEQPAPVIPRRSFIAQGWKSATVEYEEINIGRRAQRFGPVLRIQHDLHRQEFWGTG